MSNSNLIHDLDGESRDGLSIGGFVIIIAVAVILGIVGGFGLSKLRGDKTTSSTTGKQVTKTAGITDKKTFKDNAQGILREGGIDGEGSFHLERPGGKSQNVYLTSSTVDLSEYVGKKVTVWGQTFQAEKAGWLMDVGLVEVLQ